MTLFGRKEEGQLPDLNEWVFFPIFHSFLFIVTYFDCNLKTKTIIKWPEINKRNIIQVATLFKISNLSKISRSQ